MRGDTEFCRVEIDFLASDTRYRRLNDHQFRVYLCVWAMAVKERRTGFRMDDDSWPARLRILSEWSLTTPQNLLRTLSAIAQVGILEVSSGVLRVPSVERKHRRLNGWRDPYGVPVITDDVRESKSKSKRESKRRDDDAQSCAAAHSEPAPLPQDLVGLTLYETDDKLRRRWEELTVAWRVAYPGVDISCEVRKAHAWELSNPQKRKKNHPRFLGSWLARAQDELAKFGWRDVRDTRPASDNHKEAPPEPAEREQTVEEWGIEMDKMKELVPDLMNMRDAQIHEIRLRLRKEGKI